MRIASLIRCTRRATSSSHGSPNGSSMRNALCRATTASHVRR